jgi:rod shape-determining protein MreD
MLYLFLNFFLIILLFVFQTTLLHCCTILGVRPDVILILATFIGVRLGKAKGATAGFFLGLIQDCLSGVFLGPNAFSKGVVGFIFGNLRAKILFENFFTQIFCNMAAALIDGAIILIIFSLTILNKALVDVILSNLFLTAIYTALASPLFSKIFGFISKKTALLLPNKKF